MTSVQIKLTEFSDLITRYTADFVGRKWLVKQVNRRDSLDLLRPGDANTFLFTIGGQLATGNV
jgi:hypothetical protein